MNVACSIIEPYQKSVHEQSMLVYSILLCDFICIHSYTHTHYGQFAYRVRKLFVNLVAVHCRALLLLMMDKLPKQSVLIYCKMCPVRLDAPSESIFWIIMINQSSLFDTIIDPLR